MTPPPKRSDILAAAIKMMEEAERSYNYAYQMVGEQDKLRCDLLHELELIGSYDQRCKTATRLHTCLQDRRYYKDIVEETGDIAAFLKDDRTKKMMSYLRELLGKIRKQENYHASRHYVPRTEKGKSL